MAQEKYTIAFVSAHPDDEAIPFGLPALLEENGSQVHIISLTDGSLGSHNIHSRRQVAKIRQQEFLNATEVLGAIPHILGFKDGEVMPLRRMKMSLLRELRELDPDIIFIPHQKDYHDDHVQTHEVAKWAAFHLPDGPLITRRGLFKKIPPTKKPVAVYQVDTQGSQTWNSYEEDRGQDTVLAPVGMIIEVSDSAVEKSRQSFLKHKSQLGPREGKLSYPDLALLGAMRRGRQAGFAYGVGLSQLTFGGYAFTSENYLLQAVGNQHVFFPKKLSSL